MLIRETRNWLDCCTSSCDLCAPGLPRAAARYLPSTRRARNPTAPHTVPPRTRARRRRARRARNLLLPQAPSLPDAWGPAYEMEYELEMPYLLQLQPGGLKCARFHFAGLGPPRRRARCRGRGGALCRAVRRGQPPAAGRRALRRRPLAPARAPPRRPAAARPAHGRRRRAPLRAPFPLRSPAAPRYRAHVWIDHAAHSERVDYGDGLQRSYFIGVGGPRVFWGACHVCRVQIVLAPAARWPQAAVGWLFQRPPAQLLCRGGRPWVGGRAPTRGSCCLALCRRGAAAVRGGGAQFEPSTRQVPTAPRAPQDKEYSIAPRKYEKASCRVFDDPGKGPVLSSSAASRVAGAAASSGGVPAAAPSLRAPALPDLSAGGWVHAGAAAVGGRPAELWQRKDIKGQKISSYAFYVSEDGTPLRLHAVGVDILEGSHYDE